MYISIHRANIINYFLSLTYLSMCGGRDEQWTSASIEYIALSLILTAFLLSLEETREMIIGQKNTHVWKKDSYSETFTN